MKKAVLMILMFLFLVAFNLFLLGCSKPAEMYYTATISGGSVLLPADNLTATAVYLNEEKLSETEWTQKGDKIILLGLVPIGTELRIELK